jgi:hypothetical protein
VIIDQHTVDWHLTLTTELLTLPLIVSGGELYQALTILTPPGKSAQYYMTEGWASPDAIIGCGVNERSLNTSLCHFARYSLPDTWKQELKNYYLHLVATYEITLT